MLECDLRDGLIDLHYGPVTGEEHYPSLSIEPLMENRRIIGARKQHPLRLATTLEELVGAEWVTTPRRFAPCIERMYR
jgi:hypothetical protein